MNRELWLQLRGFAERFPWFEVALVTLVLAIHLYAATSDPYNFPNNWFTRDDAYYYFKVAQNISEGRGSTFDGVNPTNGYHPLWMLICVPIFALARFDLILPLRILLLVQAGLSAATGVLLYRLIRNVLSPPIAILAASWWAFNYYIHYTLYEFGLETGLAAFTLTLLLYSLSRFEREWRTTRLTRGRLAGLAILALLALLSRLDLVFVALLAGLWIILRGTRMRVLLLLDIFVAATGVLASFVYRLGFPDYYLYTNAAATMLVLCIISKIPLYYFSGLYQPPSSSPFLRSVRNILISVTASSLLVGGSMLALAGLIGSFPRAALVYDWAFNMIGVILVRWLALAFSRNQESKTDSPSGILKKSWRQWLEEAAIFYGIVAGILGAYMLWNKFVIGSATPVSGQIKRWWGNFASRAYGGPPRNPLSFWGVGFENDYDAWRPVSITLQSWSREIATWRHSYKPEEFYPLVLLICILSALTVLFMNRRLTVRAMMHFGLPVLLIGSIAQILSYNMTGYASMKEWYWVSQPVVLVLAGSLLAAVLLKPVQKTRTVHYFLLTAAIVTSLGMALNFGRLIIERMPHGPYSPDLPYVDSARFLEQNTPAGALIGLTGGGNVGYYIQGRTIVNMDGLISSPAYFRALQAGQASEYLTNIGVDYVFANPEILKGPPYRAQFKTGSIIVRYGGKALMELLP